MQFGLKNKPSQCWYLINNDSKDYLDNFVDLQIFFKIDISDWCTSSIIPP